MVNIEITNHIRLINLPKDVMKELKQSLTINNPEYEKKRRMGFFLGKTPKKLDLFSIIDNDLIVPYGLKHTILTTLQDKGISYHVDDKHVINDIIPLSTDGIALRDYQLEALDKILQNDNGILVSPCGSGKTIMALSLIEKRPYRTLWITHTHDLLTQSYNACKTLYKNKLGKISEGKVDIQDITFATVQTLSKLDLNQYKDTFTTIIVDECHKATGSHNKLKMFYTVINSLNAKYKYGVTATLFPKPNDVSSTPLYLIGEKLHEIDESEIKRVKASHDVVILQTPTSEEYLGTDKTLDYQKLVEYIVYNQERNTQVVDELIKHTNHHNLILSTRNDHLGMIKVMLRERGIDSELLMGSENKRNREYIIERFKNGDIKYLLSNYQLAKEGLDLPIADTLHMIFPVNDKITVVQSAGRVERLYKDKVSSQVIDYYDYKIPFMERLYKDRRRYLK